MKKKLRELLEQNRLDEIADLASGRRRALGLLISLTFDREPLIQWRAVESLGAAAERIAPDDRKAVRELLRRLYWLMSEESGGICWRSPEAMAEIAARLPKVGHHYIAIVVSLLTEMAEEDLGHFRPGVLWGIGRLGSAAEEGLDDVLPAIVACLDHTDPQVRGLAVRCLGRCGHAEVVAAREDLLGDQAPVSLYENGQLATVTVGDLAREAADTPPDTSGGETS